MFLVPQSDYEMVNKKKTTFQSKANKEMETKTNNEMVNKKKQLLKAKQTKRKGV